MYLLILTLMLISALSVISSSNKLRSGTFLLADFNVQRVLPLRGILALFIITHHLSQQVNSLGLPIIGQFTAWGAPVVCVFFFITGYGLMISFRTKGATYLNGFLPHRMGKLLPAFVLANIIWLFWIYLKNGSIYATLTEIPQGSMPLPNSWFVYTVILFYILFYISARTTRSVPSMLLVLWMASSVYIVILRMAHWGNWWYNSIYALNVGMTYAFYKERAKSFILYRPQIIIPLLFFVLFTGTGVPSLMHRLGITWSLQIIKCFTIPLLVTLSVYCLGAPKIPVLDFLGKISYEIYIVHGCFISLFSSMKEQWLLYFIVVFTCSIAAAWLLHIFCISLTQLWDKHTPAKSK